jgi:hypothetical protein
MFLVKTCFLRTSLLFTFHRLVELLLILIGLHQVLMEPEKMCIALVLLDRYASLYSWSYSLTYYYSMLFVLKSSDNCNMQH